VRYPKRDRVSRERRNLHYPPPAIEQEPPQSEALQRVQQQAGNRSVRPNHLTQEGSIDISVVDFVRLPQQPSAAARTSRSYGWRAWLYALRTKKTIRAITRIVPSMPPPIYMSLSFNRSWPPLHHVKNRRSARYRTYGPTELQTSGTIRTLAHLVFLRVRSRRVSFTGVGDTHRGRADLASSTVAFPSAALLFSGALSLSTETVNARWQTQSVVGNRRAESSRVGRSLPTLPTSRCHVGDELLRHDLCIAQQNMQQLAVTLKLLFESRAGESIR
jgi:hypothetical protein